jgi:beta-glucanase (GH16 family)
MQYGQVTARLKTSKWAGVVTAFITMSDVKDEVDWEWVDFTRLHVYFTEFTL